MLAALMLLPLNAALAATCTSLSAGNWNAAGRWSCGHIPVAADTVVIAHNNVRLTNNYTVAGLTINAGAVLDDNGNDLSVTGSVVNNGTFGVNGGGGRLLMTGAGSTISGAGTFADSRLYIDAANITLPAGSSMNFTNGAQIRVGSNTAGSFTIAGTVTDTGITAGNRILRVYNASTLTISGTFNTPASYAQIRSGGTVINNGTVNLRYLDGNGAATATWTQGASSNVTFTQPAVSWAGSFNASATGNTVTYNSPATPITPTTNTYYNLGGTGVTCPHTFIVLGSNPCTAPPGSGFVVSSPSTCSSVTGVGTIPWQFPQNATASDNVYATALMLPNSTSNYLNCTGFNFSAIPAGSTISGITVSIERKASSNRRARDAFVYLIKGGMIGTAFNGATATQYTTADVVAAHGGMTSLWGTTWTDTDVKAANFGVAYAVTSTRLLTVSVDHIQVRVDYSFPVAVTPSDFNIYDTSTSPANKIDGVIGTKIAGQPFTLDIAALNTAGNALLTSFTGTVKVELLDASDNTGALINGCRSTWTTLQTLANNQTFAAGDAGITGSAGRHRITPAITVGNAYKDVRVRVSYPATGTPTKVGCSTDNFAIRPASLSAVSVSDADWQTTGTARNLTNTAATGGVVHKAGQLFTIVATAYNAAATPVVTTGYDGSPVAVVNTTLPVGGVDGALTFTNPTWAVNAGTVTNTTAQYDEVGVFDMTLEDHTFAAVDSGDGTAASCAGYYVCSAAVAVGRFVPDHFELVDASADPVLDPLVNTAVDAWLPTTAHQFRTFDATDASCNAAAAAPQRSFTYIGQPFGYVTPPQATVKAMDAVGGAIQNYDPNKFDPLTPPLDVAVTQVYSAAGSALDTGLAMQPAMLAPNANYAAGTSPIVGTVTLNSADKLAFVRTVPVAPFNANITLALDVKDASESGVAGNGIIMADTPLIFASIPFDSGNQMRFGQIKMSNAYGSERLDLQVPLMTQHFNGAGFVTNTADHCTNLMAANIALGNYRGGITAANLGAGHVNFAGPFISGAGSLVLRKPNPVPAASGSADVAVDLAVEGKSYLQGKWNGSASYDQNPSARATFGVYKGKSVFIYRREAY
ncbi:MAG TPA: DUF6701 domain-containing protein [Gallionella sp.]|nr:DUF6701 domain-containing protein [Gallionella sp.]